MLPGKGEKGEGRRATLGMRGGGQGVPTSQDSSHAGNVSSGRAGSVSAGQDNRSGCHLFLLCPALPCPSFCVFSIEAKGTKFTMSISKAPSTASMKSHTGAPRARLGPPRGLELFHRGSSPGRIWGGGFAMLIKKKKWDVCMYTGR